MAVIKKSGISEEENPAFLSITKYFAVSIFYLPFKYRCGRASH